jgi:hypothetical protein
MVRFWHFIALRYEKAEESDVRRLYSWSKISCLSLPKLGKARQMLVFSAQVEYIYFVKP